MNLTRSSSYFNLFLFTSFSFSFISITFFIFIFRPLQVIPKSITIFTDALVSLDRIEAIICEAEKYDKDLFTPNKNDEKNDTKNSENSDIDDFVEKPQPTSITVKSVTAVRGKNTVILKDISFSLVSTGLTIIVGGNASGKTSLLLSILNELIFVQGKSSIRPSQVSSTYDIYIIYFENDQFNIKRI